MLKHLKQGKFALLEDWELRFAPSDLTLHNAKTGEQFHELSLVAAKVKSVTQSGTNPFTGETVTETFPVLERYLAAGSAALEYQNAPDTVVFSPLRHGQVASYDAARYLFQSLLRRMLPKARFFKPVVCIHVQEQTTQVEERAITDTVMMAGAKRVLMYTEPLSDVLRAAHTFRETRHAIYLHIEPRD